MLPLDKKTVITKTWFDGEDQMEKIREYENGEALVPINAVLEEKSPAEMFFFDHATPRHVIEFIDDRNTLVKVVEFRGNLVEEDGDWYFVGKRAIGLLNDLLRASAAKKIELSNELMEALLETN